LREDADVSEATKPVAVQEAGQAAKAYTAKAYAAGSPTSPLAPVSIQRRAPGPQDVQIEILYCGVCHSDLHQVRNEWQTVMPTVYPCVPGHEIIGRVVKTGGDVKKFKEGDLAAIGCMVDSCRTCASCRAGLEQYCENMPTFTYNLPDKHLGGVTYGGYSESIVVDEAFVLRVSDKLNPAGAAPLFKRRRLAGSAIGGIRETQEMLDFCAEHGITSDIEMIRIQQINEAYERLAKGDVKYRFVIDMASLK
jgi:D-arabinose 1-dehydrogenase-like Zn-dependent alcohol dehydrogenase